MSEMTFSNALVTAFVPCKASVEIQKAKDARKPRLVRDIRDTSRTRAAFFGWTALAVIGGIGTAYAEPLAAQALGRFSLTVGLGFGCMAAKRLYEHACAILFEANRQPPQDPKLF